MNENLGENDKNILGKNRSYRLKSFHLKDGTLVHLSNRPSLFGIWFLEISVYDSRDFFKVTHGIIFNVPLVRIKNVVNYLISCSENNLFKENEKIRVQRILNGSR